MWIERPAARRLRYSLPDEAHRPTCAEVDLSAIVHNLEVARAIVSQGVALRAPAIVAVVKADAYGHGAAMVASALERAGVDAFAVALVEEGLELRSSSVGRPILVLGGIHAQAADEALRAGLTPVVFDISQIAPLAAAARGQQVHVHIKVDTGMSRLGLSLDELGRLERELARHPEVRVSGLFTHLASADLDDPAPTQEQLRALWRARRDLRARGIAPEIVHAAASAGAVRFPEARFDMVRLGISLYGERPAPMLSVPGLVGAMRVRTSIVQVRAVPVGTPVGYGGTFVAVRPSRIATLPMGYADGLSRFMGNRGEVIVHGRRVPIVGNVCMDMAMIDVTDVFGVEVGDEVVVLGRQGDEIISAAEVAGRTGTIPYEVLTSLSRRVPRAYLPAGG